MRRTLDAGDALIQRGREHAGADGHVGGGLLWRGHHDELGGGGGAPANELRKVHEVRHRPGDTGERAEQCVTSGVDAASEVTLFVGGQQTRAPDVPQVQVNEIAVLARHGGRWFVRVDVAVNIRFRRAFILDDIVLGVLAL